jgi:hypothetical protein
VVGAGLWVAFALSPTFRGWFELLPSHHVVTDSFVFADLAVAVVASALSAWALWSGRAWAVPMVAFTAGSMAYPTAYLLGWASFAGRGPASLAIMLLPTLLTGWIAFQVWRAHLRSMAGSPP